MRLVCIVMLVVHEYVTRVPKSSLWFKRQYTIIFDYDIDHVPDSYYVFKFRYGELLFSSDRRDLNKDFHIREPATIFICSARVYFKRHGLIR